MRRYRLAALIVGLAVLFGGCAQDESTVEAPEETTEATPEPAGASTTGGLIKLADSDHGEIVVDSNGRTLYVFLQDVPGKSNCNDACAQTWPPLEAEGDVSAGDGLDESLLGGLERDDGTTQVTYDRPLYHYSGDTEAGDTKGQGIGGNWYVIGADAEPIRD